MFQVWCTKFILQRKTAPILLFGELVPLSGKSFVSSVYVSFVSVSSVSVSHFFLLSFFPIDDSISDNSSILRISQDWCCGWLKHMKKLILSSSVLEKKMKSQSKVCFITFPRGEKKESHQVHRGCPDGRKSNGFSRKCCLWYNQSWWPI